MQKFNRVYLLRVEGSDKNAIGPLESLFITNPQPPLQSLLAPAQAEPTVPYYNITLPYTLEFRVIRRPLTSSQTATFRIFNLGKNVRDAIQKDIFQRSQYRRLEFYAGYDSPDGKFVPLVFNGTVLNAFSYRVDRNWITEIEAYSGLWQRTNSNYTSISVGPNKTTRDVLSLLANQLPNMNGTPLIGDFPTVSPRGQVLFGNAWDLMVQQSKGLAFIDNNQLKVLNWNEYVTGELATISADSGLLGAPKRTETTLEFDLIFEPRLTLRQIVMLNSSTQPLYNHEWMVLALEHRGTISPSVAGECLTSVTLWFTPAQQNRRLVT